MSLTEKQALNLFSLLSKATLKVDELVAKIIDEQAWKAAGHETLCAAWEAHFSNIEFQGTVNVKIVFAMYDEGSTPLEIAAAIKGVTPRGVRLWLEERTKDDEDDLDEIARKRNKPSHNAASTIFLHLGADRLRFFEKYCAELRGCNATELTFAATLDLYNALAEEYAASHEDDGDEADRDEAATA